MTAEDSNQTALGGQPQNIEPAGFVPQEGTLSFRYILAAIRSNLSLIGFILLACMAAAVIITLLQTPRYKGVASIQINNSGNRVLSKNQDDDQSEDAMGGASDTDRFLKTQVGVLQSNGLAMRVIQRMNLMQNQRYFAAHGRPLPDASKNEAAKRDQIYKLLAKNLDISLPHDSRIATITYTSNDPQISAEVANAFATEFIQMNLKRKFDSSSYARDFLQGQLQDTKRKLQDSEKALNAYARRAGIVRVQGSGGDSDSKNGPVAGQSVTSASLLQLNQAANDAKARRISAQARWQNASSGPALSSSEVMSNVGVGTLLTQRATLESALADDRARHLDDYPTVKSKIDALAAVNRQIQLSANSIRSGIKAEYMAAQEAERDLMSQVEAAKAITLDEQDSTVQFGLLSREVDTNRQVYDGLLQRYKDLNASAGISISNVSIVDLAEAPLKPYSPNVWYNLAIGFAFALVMVIVVVAVKDQFDDSIRIPEEIETKLGLALLGVVPRTRSANPEVEMADPKSSLSEAYNSLRGSLTYSTSSGLPKTMLITSAQPSEGKTTTTFALASGLARVGKTVLLFDSDLRRPTLHRRIDYDNSEGLSTLLTSQDALMKVVHGTTQPGLSVVTSGPVPPSPTELLASVRMREVIAEASRQFDVVLIDSPPVLGLADAPMLAALVDGVIFVVEADRSRHGSLKAALRRLRAVRQNLIGGVLSKFDPLRSGNRYSSYYGYEYYQYSYKNEDET